MVPTAWIYSIQFEFWSPQLRHHLCLHSTCHLNNKIYPLTPDLHLHQYLHLCILYRLLDSRNLHKQMSSLLRIVHCIELSPTPLPQTPHGHLTAFCITFCCSPLITTMVLFIFTLMPLFFTLSFHSLSLLLLIWPLMWTAFNCRIHVFQDMLYAAITLLHCVHEKTAPLDNVR